MVIVAHFYDVESGRLALDERGHKSGYERFGIPIPRDGGITNLLDEAADRGRRFDVVICESISRVARRGYEGLSVERALEHAEVCLFAANEAIIVSGSRAQRILQRRINPSIAEYEVLNTLEHPGVGCARTCERAGTSANPLRVPGQDLPAPQPGQGRSRRHQDPAGSRRRLRANRHPDRGLAAPGRARLRRHRRTAQRRPACLPRPTPVGGPHRARAAWGKTTMVNDPVTRN
jgi:hypothetical protein